MILKQVLKQDLAFYFLATCKGLLHHILSKKSMFTVLVKYAEFCNGHSEMVHDK